MDNKMLNLVKESALIDSMLLVYKITFIRHTLVQFAILNRSFDNFDIFYCLTDYYSDIY